jgi:hypothetical protein
MQNNNNINKRQGRVVWRAQDLKKEVGLTKIRQ